MRVERFFDTAILVYAVAEDEARTPVAEELLAEGGTVSVQVLNEFIAVARRKLGMDWSEVRGALQSFRILCAGPAALTADTHEAALGIAERYGFHIYDSLILASALDAGCTTLYSEDMQDGQTMGGLTVRNPFAAG